MPISSFFRKMMALFLLLSFLLLSTTVLSFFVGERAAGTAAASSQSESTDSTASVSFFVCNFIDFLEAENFAFKLGLGPAFQSRKILTVKSAQLFGAVICTFAALLFASFCMNKRYPPLNLSRITEFLHAKDGMI